MELESGTRLGPYEVLGPLGAGGMGVVYRATDTNLKRQVAIKVLPASVAGDADRLSRFQREAEVLAALNHPNVAAIYGLEKSDGTIALVMELVEGPTLADRIAQGAVPVDEALHIARQIAEALEAAHEQGIVHRDLKPANIKVRPDGTVKVLDFGLAAVAQGAGAIAADVTNSPTLTLAATRAGVILGTAGYMSPEQAAAKPVDKRADIWSFGVVLWEMLTGTRLFDGESVSHTLADVLRSEIDFDRLPGETPQSVRVLLRRCLDRDVKARLRDIGEARVALQRYLADPAGARSASAAAVPPSAQADADGGGDRCCGDRDGRRRRPGLGALPRAAARRPHRSVSRCPLPPRRRSAARGCCRRTAAASPSTRPARTAARSCGCGPSMCSTRGPWPEPRG